MDLAKWLQDFRALHQKARNNTLTAREHDAYLAGRNELARAILASQKMGLVPGQVPRQALRAARVLPIEIEVHGRMRPHLTMEISAGGFASILAEAPPNDRLVRFSLKLPNEQELISGEAACVQTTPQPGRCRCCFRFENLGSIDREKLELFVFDVLLENIKG